MSEEFPESAEESGEAPNLAPTTEEIVMTFEDLLRQEDIEHMRDMEPDEAIGYLLLTLAEYGESDPEGLLIVRGILEGIKTDELFDQEAIGE